MNAKLTKCLRLLAPCSAITCIATYVLQAQLSHVRPTASDSKNKAFERSLTTNMAHGGSNEIGDFGLLQYDVSAAATQREDRRQMLSGKEREDVIMASGSKSAPVFDFRVTSFAPLRASQETVTASPDYSMDAAVAYSSKSMPVFSLRPTSKGELARGKYFTKAPAQQTNTSAAKLSATK